jgi:hypothetical protein
VNSLNNAILTLLLALVTYLTLNIGIGQNPTFAFISTLTVLCLIDLLRSLGRTIPIIELTVFLMVVQMLYAPALEFYFYPNFLDLEEWKSLMVSEPETYFNFTLPATLFFIAGIYIPYRRKTSALKLKLAIKKLKIYKQFIDKIGIALIIVGAISTVLSDLVNVGALNFILLLFSYLKFIGLFYLIICKSRYLWAALIIVMVPFAISIFISSVFINLVIWTFFIGSYFIINKKYSMTFKVGAFLAMIFLGTIIQVTKHQYRQIVWLNAQQIEGNKLETFGKLIVAQINSLDQEEFILSLTSLSQRLNQGIILSYIIENIPDNRPIVNGRFFYNELLGVALPRFVFPDKPVVGDRDKFEYLAGWRLGARTSMNVGIMGDGYGNFGLNGGMWFCFGFGLFLSVFFKKAMDWSQKRPSIILWLPLLFFYSMRAGNEFYIIANWIVKSGVIVLAYFLIFERSRYQIILKKSKLKSN